LVHCSVGSRSPTYPESLAPVALTLLFAVDDSRRVALLALAVGAMLRSLPIGGRSGRSEQTAAPVVR
jgi:hypothetical protein